LALERADAVAHLRRVMGATDVAKAEPGTIRNLYGTSIEKNAIHGSDSAEKAALELAFFFSRAELHAARQRGTRHGLPNPSRGPREPPPRGAARPGGRPLLPPLRLHLSAPPRRARGEACL